VRRVAKERRLTLSRALVTLAERGVQAEADARKNLQAAYRRFMSETEAARKDQAGRDLVRAIFGKTPLPKIQFSDLPRGVWQHLLGRVEQRQVSLQPYS